MKIAESVLREKISSILKEDSRPYKFDLGLGAGEAIEVKSLPAPKADRNNTQLIDLSDLDENFKVQRLTIIVDAISSVGENNSGWKIISENMLKHFGFGSPLGKSQKFFDVTKGDVGYSVKSSFAKSRLRGTGVLSNAYLSFGTLFSKDRDKEDEEGKLKIVRPDGITKASVALCYRDDKVSTATFSEGKFDIVWGLTKPLTFEELREKIVSATLRGTPPYMGSREDTKSEKPLRFSPPQLALGYKPDPRLELEETFYRLSGGDFKAVFGKQPFESYLKIRFKDYAGSKTSTYELKIKVIEAVKRANLNQMRDIERLLVDYINM